MPHDLNSFQQPMIGVGIVGMGFMGATHARAYQAADVAGFRCRIAGVCDVSANAGAAAGGRGPIALQGDSPFVGVHRHPTIDDLLADPAIRLVSICTYTDSHVDLAVKALQAGKHVIVEKPVALKAADVARLREHASRSGTHCMPAMCMRFWPGWSWLRERIADQRYGAVRSAVFQRLGSRPAWASAFYGDVARSGGAVVDLHIHDVDFIIACFGAPRAVVSVGSHEHIITHYRMADSGIIVTAEGGWTLPAAAPFRMRYTVCFEHATADFDLARTDRLLLWTADEAQNIPLEPLTGYDGEIRHMLQAIATGARTLDATLDDAVTVMRVLHAEIDSARTFQSRFVDGDQ